MGSILDRNMPGSIFHKEASISDNCTSSWSASSHRTNSVPICTEISKNENYYILLGDQLNHRQ